MGRKRTRAGKYLYFYIAGLIILCFLSCTTIRQIGRQDDRENQYLLRGQDLLIEGDYEGSLAENRKVLSISPQDSPGDQALFNMGLIYAHYGNPKKDYKKSLIFFRKVLKEFPDSFLMEQAKTWADVLEVIEKAKLKEQKRYEAEGRIARGQDFLIEGDYEGSLAENRKVLSLSPQDSPGDQALFNMGLIYAHYGNPKKDYKKSLIFFRKVLKEFPESALVEQAKIWSDVLQVIENLQKVDQEIEEKKKERSR